MTDFSTYNELHPENPYLKSTYTKNPLADTFEHSLNSVESETNLPADGSEPTAPEIYLFQTHLPGFDLRRKKWGE